MTRFETIYKKTHLILNCTTYYKDECLRIFHHPTEPAEVVTGYSVDSIQYGLDGLSHHPQRAAYRDEEFQIWELQEVTLLSVYYED